MDAHPMSGDVWTQDIDKAVRISNNITIHVVWPLLAPVMGGGHLTPTTTDLDLHSGVDLHWVKPNGTRALVGARVRTDGRDWRSHTFRVDTELPKMRRHLADADAVHVAYLIQSHVILPPSRRLEDVVVQSAAAVRPRALIDRIPDPPVPRIYNTRWGTYFTEVRWDQLDPADGYMWVPCDEEVSTTR